MILVFGRGVYESRSPIYIHVRAEVRLWGGSFPHDQYYLDQVVKSVAGRSGQIPETLRLNRANFPEKMC